MHTVSDDPFPARSNKLNARATFRLPTTPRGVTFAPDPARDAPASLDDSNVPRTRAEGDSPLSIAATLPQRPRLRQHSGNPSSLSALDPGLPMSRTSTVTESSSASSSGGIASTGNSLPRKKKTVSIAVPIPATTKSQTSATTGSPAGDAQSVASAASSSRRFRRGSVGGVVGVGLFRSRRGNAAHETAVSPALAKGTVVGESASVAAGSIATEPASGKNRKWWKFSRKAGQPGQPTPRRRVVPETKVNPIEGEPDQNQPNQDLFTVDRERGTLRRSQTLVEGFKKAVLSSAATPDGNETGSQSSTITPRRGRLSRKKSLLSGTHSAVYTPSSSRAPSLSLASEPDSSSVPFAGPELGDDRARREPPRPYPFRHVISRRSSNVSDASGASSAGAGSSSADASDLDRERKIHIKAKAVVPVIGRLSSNASESSVVSSEGTLVTRASMPTSEVTPVPSLRTNAGRNILTALDDVEEEELDPRYTDEGGENEVDPANQVDVWDVEASAKRFSFGTPLEDTSAETFAGERVQRPEATADSDAPASFARASSLFKLYLPRNGEAGPSRPVSAPAQTENHDTGWPAEISERARKLSSVTGSLGSHADWDPKLGNDMI